MVSLKKFLHATGLCGTYALLDWVQSWAPAPLSARQQFTAKGRPCPN